MSDTAYFNEGKQLIKKLRKNMVSIQRQQTTWWNELHTQ